MPALGRRAALGLLCNEPWEPSCCSRGLPGSKVR